MRVWRLRLGGRRRSPWLLSSLKPYWGKPTVRNFRGGGGNTRMASASTQALNGHWVKSCFAHLWCASSLLGVERDLETLERYVRALLRLRTLHRYVSDIPRLRQSLPSPDKEPEPYFSQVLILTEDPEISARANSKFAKISFTPIIRLVLPV